MSGRFESKFSQAILQHLSEFYGHFAKRGGNLITLSKIVCSFVVAPPGIEPGSKV